MAIREKLTDEDLMLYEIVRHPALCREFLENLDNEDVWDEEKDVEWWEHTRYQNEFICDFNNYVSICCGRSVGKTVALVSIIFWILINDVFDGEYICYTVPNKVHLDPVWLGLTRMLRINTLLQQYLSPRGGINSSDHTVKLLNEAALDCRIAGTSGTGANVVGMHTPFEIVDECVVGTQKVAGKNSNKPISSIEVGDIVLSWDGENIVEDRVSSTRKIKRKQRVLEIQFEDSYIRVGENHRIYMADGYKQAKNLSIGENIYFYKNTKRKYWNLNEINFIKSQIQKSVSVKEIAKILNRTPQAIFRKMDSLGLSIREVYDNKKLSEEEYQIILGSFLGDGSARIELDRAGYTTNHSLKQKEYVDWLKNKLKRLVRTEPRVYKNGGWGTLNYSFGTLGHPQILEIAEKLYINGRKTVTREYLDKLSPLGLAVWWMDDGSESGMLSTHSFSKEENEIIVKYLKEKWGIDSYIAEDTDKNLYFIKLRNWHINKLRNIIKKHVPECMKYKIGEGFYNSELPKLEIIKRGEDKSTLEEHQITNIREVNTRARYLYDIEVENNHNYFVNGILTKNSGFYPWGTWIELQPTLNTWEKGHRRIVSGVPTGVREKNVLYYADQLDEEYTKHRISAHDNPRYTEKDEKDNLIKYGGEDSDDYLHHVLGEHGAPTFAVFDRTLMEIKTYPVFKLKLNGIQLTNEELFTRISTIPPVEEAHNYKIMGIDLGYTDPTSIIILLVKNTGIYFYARIELQKVKYPTQKKLIDFLDERMKRIEVIGIDAGSPGVPVIHDLMEGDAYVHKDYAKRLVPVDFGGQVILGIDSEGEEIKSKLKPFAVSLTQEYSNSHRLIYSSTDTELITELERMTYVRNDRGDIRYKTLTPMGGQRGEDHHTAALLAGIVANYQMMDAELYKKKTTRLASTSWRG